MALSDLMRPTSFTLTTEARWDVQCLVAPFPAGWLDVLEEVYRARPGIQDGWSLPTRSLVELLIGLDPAIIHVHWDLRGPRFITAMAGVDTEIIAAAIASWAGTEVAPDGSGPDWWDLCRAEDLSFEAVSINLLERGTHPNGTAAPAPAVFQLLPSFLAQDVVAGRMPLLVRERDWIMGPPTADGRRTAVLWPPDTIEDPKAGSGLATAKITFRVQTVPNHPVPHVHADLSISRFPLMPVTYVPPRGKGPSAVTIWLHAPTGFLREGEPHTLLAASAQQTWTKASGSAARQWRWKPGLATALSRLTHLPFPDPDKVLTQPGVAAEEGSVRAFILYSEGTKSRAEDIEVSDDVTDHGDEKPAKARSLLHAANTGLVPGDHIEAHESLARLLRPRGLDMIGPLERAGKRSYRRVKPREQPDQTYVVELWTQSSITRDAVLATLEHHHGLTPSIDTDDATIVHFTGTITIDVIIKDAGTLGAGIERPTDEKRPDATLIKMHTDRMVRELDPSPAPRAAILELEDDRYFLRARKIDPKKSLKRAFGRTDRRLQCLRPAKLFTPPTKPPKEGSKKPPPSPYPGTPFTRGTIYRASAAINDALRQLGRLGTYDTPVDLPDLEQIGVWLHRDGSSCIPLVVRLKANGDATASLASPEGSSSDTLPYRDLAKALADRKGRIPPGPQQKSQVARFLTQALGIGDNTSQDTHDRIVLIRAASFRNWGWDWLQDKHIRPDMLALPGVNLNDDSAPPQWRTPTQCPGLRVIRVRDRSSEDEVPRGFAADHETTSVRISGLFTFSDRIFYSINPRSDQMQIPLGTTKINPDVLRNYTAQASSPNPLEISPIFLQRQDSPSTYATLVSQLRRSYLHTEQATQFPAALHLCALADEYI